MSATDTPDYGLSATDTPDYGLSATDTPDYGLSATDTPDYGLFNVFLITTASRQLMKSKFFICLFNNYKRFVIQS